MPEPGMTVAESVPSIPPVPRPPRDAPNVIAIVLDDTGFGHLGCFGSDIATPHLDWLAAGGLRFNRFHVTSLCSPTRASFFTGRNHHAVGMGFLADIPLAFPGYTARLPRSAATLPRLLRDAGYYTMAVGKWHLTPRGNGRRPGPFDRWPLGYWASSATTGSCRATPTTGPRTWCATTTTSSRRAGPRRATT